MFNPYVDVIGYYYPQVKCHASGVLYTDIVYDGLQGDDPLPTQAVLEPLIIECKRLKKWEEIKDYRDNRLDNGGYPTSVGWFHSDARSKDNYEDANKPNSRAALLALEQNNTPKYWKVMSGGFVGFTIGVLDELLTNKITQKDQHFYAAEVLKIGLWLSPDPDNFDYKQNAQKTKWPVIYGE